ncbi:MAG: DsbA family oxidoreductase [Chloroflexota bacterium]|nr:DsbA family oxidoreductase [Chloroflexota bacterium]
MPTQIDVWSDFVCPWCYAAALSIRTLKETHDVTLRWHSFELRPAGSPPMDPAYFQHIETNARPRFNAMMMETYGIQVNAGPFGINSRDALIGEKVADAHGVGAAYHELVTRAYWDDARDISDRTVLRAIAETIGMDGDAFIAGLDDSQYDDQVTADVLTAQQAGISAVPALVFGGRYLVSGAQPADVLRQIVDQVTQETAAPRS